MAQCQAALPGTLDDSPYTSDVSPKSSKVGAFPPHPPQFCEKISVSRHQKSRKGTNPIRLNDANPSFLPIRRSTFVYTAPYPDVLSVQTCKNNHPSFVSKLGWLYGRGRRIRTLNKGFGDHTTGADAPAALCALLPASFALIV